MTEIPTLDDLFDYQSKDPQQALDAAVTQVRTYCRWHIAPSLDETVDVWSDGRSLFLDTLNLTAVTSITQDGVAVTPTSFESYGLIRGSFNTLTRATVVFSHGYDTMPDDVKNVILSLAQRSITDTRGLVTRTSAAGASAASLVATYGPQFSDADKEKLSAYVLPSGFA